jgi:sugar phosphate isomerase/epimerase
MDILCSPAGIADPMYPGQGVNDMEAAGFTKLLVDFSWFCPPKALTLIGTHKKHLLFDSTEQALAVLRDRLQKFTDCCRSRHLHLKAAQAPYLQDTANRGDLHGLFLRRMAEGCIQQCGLLGCRCIIIRPLATDTMAVDDQSENWQFYLSLAEVARKYDVKILLVNQCHSLYGHFVRGFCSDAGTAVEWIDRLNRTVGSEQFGFCLDVGACSLCGQDMRAFSICLGQRLHAVILRDGNGDTDSTMLPFTAVQQGQPRTDWLNLIRGLREAAFDGILILDFQDTAMAFSPLLRPSLLQMAMSVGKYIAWQVALETLLAKYPSRVLFGAGNMCRNYMKCYGEKYPPLFTCDNNTTLWETEFCTLTVKSPEALRSLPQECAIFICNIYYREIETQVRAMGIKNPIVYFNDEYMPMFYFDRLYCEERIM